MNMLNCIAKCYIVSITISIAISIALTFKILLAYLCLSMKLYGFAVQMFPVGFFFVFLKLIYAYHLFNSIFTRACLTHNECWNKFALCHYQFDFFFSIHLIISFAYRTPPTHLAFYILNFVSNNKMWSNV